MADMKLELVPIPVSNLDRARTFYVEKVGFNLDFEVQPNAAVRIIQLTPPGSGCSIMIGQGMGELTDRQPGIIKGLHLVVSNIQAVRQEMVERGVEMSEIEDMGGVLYSWFSDPDGNTWTLQEITPNAKYQGDAEQI